MRDVDICHGNFMIGRQGENHASRVRVPKEVDWVAAFGTGEYQLLYVRPTETDAYACTITDEDGFVVWEPTAEDTAITGRGHIEVIYSNESGVVAKERIYDVLVDAALSNITLAPTPVAPPELTEAAGVSFTDAPRAVYSCEKTFFLGRVGENGSTAVYVPKIVLEGTGEGQWYLVVQRSQDEGPYPVAVTEEGDYLKWIVTAADTAYEGRGHLQVIFIGTNGSITKGEIYDTIVEKALDDMVEPPSPWQSYIEEVLLAEQKIEDMTATASVTSEGETGVVVTKTETEDSFNLDFAFTGIGADTVIESYYSGDYTTGGVMYYEFYTGGGSTWLQSKNPPLIRIWWNHNDLAQTETVDRYMVGTVRRAGATGTNRYIVDFGEMGIYAVRAGYVDIPKSIFDNYIVSKDTYETTLRTWPQSLDSAVQAQMRDNIGAASGSDLQTHTSNTTIHVTAEDKNAWNAKYDKPGTGIPASDLSQAVQTTLQNADEHIADTDIHVTPEDKTAWSAKYDLPAGGIPESDLAQNVQKVLDNSAAVIDAIYDKTVGSKYSFKTLLLGPDVLALKPTTIRLKWNHADVTDTSSFDRYATGVLKLEQSQNIRSYTADFGEAGEYLMLSIDLFGETAPFSFDVAISDFEAYFTTIKEPTSLRVWAQTFDSAEQAQARANIGAAAASDIPTQTSDLTNDGADGTSTYVEADELATVATSGAYSDLSGTPTIPTNTSDLTNNGSDGTSVYVEADELAMVATTGAYSDLSGTPTIHDVPAGGNAGQVLKKHTGTDYDVYWANETDTYPSGYCTTAGGTATKVVNCSLWTATADTYLHILLAQANTAAEAISMRINASVAIPVFINGEPSSATNYTLPAGTYLAFYDGTNIHLRTDGQLPGNIVGEAAATEAKLLTKADSVGATANYAAKLTASIPYGECDNTSTSTAFTAAVPGITELKDGVCMLLYNGVITSASGFTINVNGLGAKPSYNNMTLGNPVTPTNPTRDTTIFNINYAFLFVYSETIVSGGCWIGYRGYDANTNTIGYQLRTNQTTMPTTDKFYRYRLLFTSADGTKWVPANTSTSTNATAVRTPNTRAIDPFGEIVWYGTTTAIEANATVTAAQLWQQYYGSYCGIGYSFNNTGAAATMTANKPIYIVCTPQADGSAVIDPTTPYTQTLPSTADGKIYIYLGRAYNATLFEITMKHPIYYHDGVGIRIWTGIPSLPAVTSADNGKVLTVVNGIWTAV